MKSSERISGRVQSILVVRLLFFTKCWIEVNGEEDLKFKHQEVQGRTPSQTVEHEQPPGKTSIPVRSLLWSWLQISFMAGWSRLLPFCISLRVRADHAHSLSKAGENPYAFASMFSDSPEVHHSRNGPLPLLNGRQVLHPFYLPKIGEATKYDEFQLGGKKVRTVFWGIMPGMKEKIRPKVRLQAVNRKKEADQARFRTSKKKCRWNFQISLEHFDSHQSAHKHTPIKYNIVDICHQGDIGLSSEVTTLENRPIEVYFNPPFYRPHESAGSCLPSEGEGPTLSFLPLWDGNRRANEII